MPDLIPFSTHMVRHKTVNTVDGRDLHTFLSIGKDYSSWIKSQVKRAHLIEDIDFIVFTQKGENLHGGRPTMEYHLTFDAAKHVAMMSGAEKGHEVRDYFIAKEKELATVVNDPSVLLNRYPELLAIQNLLVATAEARDIAEEAKQQAEAAETRATRAEVKADLALEDAHRMTVEEFVIKNGLVHQYPPSSYRRISGWLADFCYDNAVDFRKAPVRGKVWDGENSYPLQAFAAFWRAELRRPRQITLVKETGTDEERNREERR